MEARISTGGPPHQKAHYLLKRGEIYTDSGISPMTNEEDYSNLALKPRTDRR